MFWQEDEDKTLPDAVPDAVLDVSFAIRCKRLPLDHAWALSQAIRQALPWFADEPLAGVHTIHVAESGNGWQRPEDDGQFLIPSRRTRLLIRIPKHRHPALMTLSGQTLAIAGQTLVVGDSRDKPFINAPVLFARYVLSAVEEEEPAFLARMAAEIRNRTEGFKVRKMLCGKSHALYTPEGMQHTRHLMIADLDNAVSIRLQQCGLGGGQQLGCGLLLPHKGIKTLKPAD
ncbi:MAG: type I-MYXAN CRISPR-associated protein Cas6/Cmx6 [Thiothrix sp.]|nr:type I-MYXAN CRISPR-associated protein Cas6/Cmx6 [Thiothrix sp.]HPQ94559.1 type I-MYXAN CRISPR-associated protein Cas6/Cmx6 [Thiolinea sp.]